MTIDHFGCGWQYLCSQAMFRPKLIPQNLNSTFESRASISSLRVKRRRDCKLDRAIEKDREWLSCARVVREVLVKPSHKCPVRLLFHTRITRNLPFPLHHFVHRYPGLLHPYNDRVKPGSRSERFVRPGPRLRLYLADIESIYKRNEELIVMKLCKLLMLSRARALSCDKLSDVKREFGFPDDFLKSLVPRYPNYFRFAPGEREGEAYLGLVSWNEEYGKSVIELRAEEESRSIGMRVRPAFDWKLPKWFLYKKAMREWVRDWMELPYVSPYGEEGWKLDPASREAEKRRIAVFHELLSLSLYKRMTVDVLGKFCEDYDYSNAFTTAFTRHQGLFYVSLVGGTRTIFLREAYEDGKLVDRSDPLLDINDKFIQMIEEVKDRAAEKQKLKEEMFTKKSTEASKKPEIVFYDSD